MLSQWLIESAFLSARGYRGRTDWTTRSQMQLEQDLDSVSQRLYSSSR